MKPISQIASTMGKKHHPPILSMIKGYGGQLGRIERYLSPVSFIGDGILLYHYNINSTLFGYLPDSLLSKKHFMKRPVILFLWYFWVRLSVKLF